MIEYIEDNKKNICKLVKLIDYKQREVKWSVLTSTFLIILLILLDIYHNFIILIETIEGILQILIGSAIGLIGVSVSGVAIVIALFSTNQIKKINQIQEGSFETILYDFEWMAISSIIDFCFYIVLLFVIRYPGNLVPKELFYVIVFVVSYMTMYLLLYGCALIGNCIKILGIRSKIDNIIEYEKENELNGYELQLDFLIFKLCKEDKNTAKKYYKELEAFLEKSNLSNKEELIIRLKSKFKN